MHRFVFCGLLAVPFMATCQGGQVAEGLSPSKAIIASRVPLAHLLDSLAISPSEVNFHVDKSDRLFTVMGKGQVLMRYPCVLGEKPVGDKFHQGDRKTPEGTFMFRGKREHAQWHKFIWVDYPNAESWRRFKERSAEGLIPAGKDIGGEIGIHGVPDGMDHWIEAGADWTGGCIALRNTDVDEIYPYIRTGHTAITIEP